ncbi:crosslink repair DNA glycosylase YcaQ family protein [Acinetobacter gerneri]|uniref:winged helix-turn-helix domain-containing protein n=1 Tax=Acinetobacter gerneri TaxID=202952 RepID=UPI0029367FCD|nr:crosslink repair DNA glycosylase YcaQ family protein [Acinetobacter gerneri]MDV2439593.1 crosslink repair DNA glycosylase YcaQ family protein [Acinetobacter gerneri]
MTDYLRRITLKNQGLNQNSLFSAGLTGTQQAIEQLGYVQIDTISVIERAHHHILWNRVPDYQLEHLNTLVAKQQIFEYWFHAAAYLPMRDYRFALPQMHAVRDQEFRYFKNGDTKLMQEIVARMRSDGKLRLRDIDPEHKISKGQWWNSGAGRRSLQQLFMQGKIMICERNGMEKTYDLTENCLPNQINLSIPNLQEYAEYLFETTRRAHGVFTWKQLIHLKTGKKIRDAMQATLNANLDAKNIEVIKLENGQILYVDPELFNEQSPTQPALKLLSPFDNLVIHRERLSHLFDFDYRIECYVPKDKRIFGYFCLPILYKEQIVGLIDCKAHRAQQTLEVVSLHIQNTEIDREQFLLELKSELLSFAKFNACIHVEGL